MKSVSSGKHFPHYKSMGAIGKTLKGTSLIWPDSELVRDIMPVQIICKSHKDPIETKKGYAPDKIKYGVFRHSRTSNSEVNSPICAGIQTLPRFYGCPGYLQVWRWFDQKWWRYPPDNIFSVISLWENASSLKDEQLQSEWSYLARNRTCSEILWLSSLSASLTEDPLGITCSKGRYGVRETTNYMFWRKLWHEYNHWLHTCIPKEVMVWM